MTVDLAEARERLQPAVEMLQADGYDLDISQVGDALRLAVVATEAACEECLVTKDIFVGVVESMLAPAGGGPQLVIVYPADGDPAV